MNGCSQSIVKRKGTEALVSGSDPVECEIPHSRAVMKPVQYFH